MTARTRRFVGLALMVVLLLAFWAWTGRRGDVSAAAAATASGNAASGAATSVLARVMATPASAGVLPVQAAVLPAFSAVPGGTTLPEDLQMPPEGAEVCGVGRVTAADVRRWKADPAQGQAEVKVLEARMQRNGEAGLARMAARLAAGNEHQQVAARLMMGDRDGAAMLAERSGDVLAYQMALTACGGAREGAPHCARLNPRRWAEMDPTDARPWLRLMEEARDRKDEAAVSAALAEAAARPRLSRGSFLLEAQAVVTADVIPDAAELGPALVAIIGIDAMSQRFDLGAPLRICRGEGLQDPTRLGHCRSLARQALANASDLMDASAAQSMAERVGLPREQRAYDAATLKAAQEKFMERVLADIGMDCAAMRRMKQLSTERAASGELATALALLPPGKSAR